METKVFSDDVIQRIASGNEPTQTLISLDMLKKVLNPKQMRNVLGGSDDSYECRYYEMIYHVCQGRCIGVDEYWNEFSGTCGYDGFKCVCHRDEKVLNFQEH